METGFDLNVLKNLRVVEIVRAKEKRNLINTCLPSQLSLPKRKRVSEIFSKGKMGIGNLTYTSTTYKRIIFQRFYKTAPNIFFSAYS